MTSTDILLLSYWCICFKISLWMWTSLCTSREGSISLYLGNWEICWLCPRQDIHPGNRSQTAVSSIRRQEPGSSATQDSSFSSSSISILLLCGICAREATIYCRYPLKTRCSYLYSWRSWEIVSRCGQFCQCCGILFTCFYQYSVCLQTAQVADSICQKVIQYCQEGWPKQMSPLKQLHPYWGLGSSTQILCC